MWSLRAREKHGSEIDFLAVADDMGKMGAFKVVNTVVLISEKVSLASSITLNRSKKRYGVAEALKSSWRIRSRNP